MPVEEIIIPENNKEGLPYIRRVENVFYMTNSSIPLLPGTQFDSFFESVRNVREKQKSITIEINLGYFSSTMKAVFHRLFIELTETWYLCKPTIKWFYAEDDEDTFDYGETFRDLYKKITFEFISTPKPK